MSGPARIPLHRDPRIRGLAFQIVLLSAVGYGLYYLFDNAITNLNRQGIVTSFSFLNSVAPFNLDFSPFLNFKLGESTYWKVFFIGIQNTIFVSILGIIFATILGFLIGVARLSPNWLLSRMALVYIEMFRNIPLLLWIMFWNFIVFLPILPQPRQSWGLFDTFFLNARGFYTPLPQNFGDARSLTVFGVILAGLVMTYFVRRWSLRRQDLTGERFPALSVGLIGTVVATVAAYYLLGKPFGFDVPQLGRFNLSGGFEFPLPLFCLWFALVTYTAAFIAEQVRAGIQAVPKGQNEAASALGLKRGDMLRLVTIPQAMRIIVPPTISQYLNLTKNSSLAVAIGYEDIVNIWSGISLNQTGQALIIIAMTILVYEFLSLFTSFILNVYNKRVQLVER